LPPFWSDVARTTRLAVPLLLVCGAVQVAAVAALPRDLDGLTTWVLLPFVNYILYRIALFDLPAPYLTRLTSGAPPGAPFRFLLSLALPFVLIVGAFVALYLISWPASGMGRMLLNLSLYGLFWLALSFFGTLLPAAAAGQRLSPAAALWAAEGRWTGVAINLFLVAGVGGAGILFAAFSGKFWLDSLQAAPPVHYTVDTLLTALAWASLIPTVVVLTRAYRQGWPQDAAARPF
jgi:hypothetical protein